MFCTQCGKAISDDDKFCGHCGAQLEQTIQPSQASQSVESTDQPIPTQVTTAALQVRPWVRYWARLFDIYIATIVGGIAFGIFYPEAFNQKGSEHFFMLIVVFIWMFIESLLLSVTGTTPGKWLFKTHLIPPSGDKPNYSTALSRSFNVWWRGLAIGFPLAIFITCIVAYRKLTKNGTTTWDIDDGFTVVHERIGPLRIIVAVTFLLGFLLLIAAGNAANA